MIRTKGEPGTGDVVHAVTAHAPDRPRDQGPHRARRRRALQRRQESTARPTNSSAWSRKAGKLPVPNFSAGGIATPADAALMMQLGAETVFVGSGIFMKERATPLDVENNPSSSAKRPSPAPSAIVIATTHFNDPKIVAEASEAVTGTMKGLAAAAIEEQDLMQTRGW